MISETRHDWLRVSAHDPCPACGSDSWCTVAPDRSAARCKRHITGREAHGADGDAWIHVLSEQQHSRTALPPREKASTVDWGSKASEFASTITDARVDQLADSLGVDAIALRELGIGCDGDSYTLPMFDGTGSVVGIKVRTLAGEKRAMPGSKLGVMRRQVPTDASDGMLLVTEGESDLMAALSYGFDAIGVPGAGQCAEIIAVYAKERDVVVFADADVAGATGAAKIAAAVRNTAKSVRIVTPPVKDLRQWRYERALRGDIEQAIANAKPLSRGPIADAWVPLPAGSLSTTPPPRKWLLRHPDREGVPVDDRHGDGMLPLGKVALFASAGGVGKTMALIEAACAVITGRRWFGHFDVDKEATGDVLLVLGEEDALEVHRRLFTVAEVLEMTDAERRDVERRLVVLPFAGVQCVVASGSSAELRKTNVIDELLRLMAGRQWSLAVFDPLSRFAGVPIDLDNTNATFVVQQFERLAIATGAAVVVSHHTSRESRKQGRADPRGATGIEDGVRWVATLTASGDVVRFLQTKSNYSRPMREQDVVILVRDRGGRLRVQTAAERAAADEDVNTTEKDVDAVVEALRQLGGRCRTRGAIVKQSGVRKQDGLAAVDIAFAKRRILWEPMSAPERTRYYVLPAAEGAHTPHTPGNQEPGFPGSADQEPGSVPGTGGTEREPGTGEGEEGPGLTR